MPGQEDKHKTVGSAFYISVYRIFADKVFDVFRQVFNERTCNLKLHRQDKISLSAKVPQIARVMDNIEKADVIFCILSYTSSYFDENSNEFRTAPSPISHANIYFELGYAFALKKKNVYLFLDEDRNEYETPPFNIRSFPIIEYTEGNLKAILTKKIVPNLEKEFEWFKFNPPPSTASPSPTGRSGAYPDYFNWPVKK